MNLKLEKEVARAHLPSLSRVITLEMFLTWEVKGAAMEASVWERERPISACLRELQSLAPSPHIPISVKKVSYKHFINYDF